MIKQIISFLLLFSICSQGIACNAKESEANVGSLTSASDSIFYLSEGHVRYISDFDVKTMEILNEHGKTGQMVIASDFIPIRSNELVNIVFNPQDNSASSDWECYLYFYDENRIITWDILDYIDEQTGERNRISCEFLKQLNGFQFVDIPDGYYIRIAPINGCYCKLLIWDGDSFGYPIVTNTSFFDNDGKKKRLSSNAIASIQIPSSADYLIAKPGYTFINLYYSDTERSYPALGIEYRFPSQIIELRSYAEKSESKNISLVKDYNYKTKEYSMVMPESDISQFVVAVDTKKSEDTICSLNPTLLNNLKDCLEFAWEDKINIANINSYKEGITYYGIPYRSNWTSASSVGWHVTKQTFMNAANDPQSIFYHTPSEQKAGLYYSLVCSSFATLVCGFPYPMSNYGMMRDPNVTITVSKPKVGTLMTNGTTHCFIPINESANKNEAYQMTLAEQMVPLTTLRNVYNGIADLWKGIGPKTSYPQKYIFACSIDEQYDVPYNITTFNVRNGSARPYRGDQSVYTSDMDVLINIKDPDATRLYLQRCEVTLENGVVRSFEPKDAPRYGNIEPGTKQVNVRSATNSEGYYSGMELENGAIYAVWASVGDMQPSAPENAEFFEWYDLEKEKVFYTVKNGILYTDDMFWYVITNAYSDSFYLNEKHKSGILSIGYQAPIFDERTGEIGHSNYSLYFDRCILKSITSVRAFFRKGLFGAYVTGKENIE